MTRQVHHQSELEEQRNYGVVAFYRLLHAQLQGRGWSLLVLVLSGMVRVGYMSLMPLAMQRLFDHAIPERNVAQLSQWLILIVCGYGVHMLAVLTEMRAVCHLAMQIIVALRQRIYSAVFAQGQHLLERQSSTSILGLFTNDMAAIEGVLVNTAWANLRQLVFIVISMGVLVFLAPYLALISVLLAPLTIWLSRRYALRSIHDESPKKMADGQLLQQLQEAIALRKIIRILLLQPFKLKRFQQTAGKAFVAGGQFHRSHKMIAISTEFGMQISALVVLCFGIVFVYQQWTSIGALVAFISLLLSTSAALAEVSNGLASVLNASGALYRINHFLRQRKDVCQPNADLPALPKMQQVIHISDLGYQVAEQWLLKAVSLDILIGQSIAIVGSSGSGKTTLLYLLLAQARPTTGQITVDGQPVEQFSQASYLDQMGVVLQETYLFETSILDNIRMGHLAASDEAIYKAAQQAEIHQEILAMPEGYQTVITNADEQLSGGQRQRICLARALLGDPAILCMDEVTSALDPINETAVNQTLTQLAEDHTIITITHRLRTVMHMDAIFVMQGGRLVESGTHESLMAEQGYYHQLWEKQSGVTIGEQGRSAKVRPDWLRHIPMFASLDDASLKLLAEQFSLERRKPNKVVFREGEYGDKFYIIAAGTVIVEKVNASGNMQLLATLQDGDFFGEIALLSDVPRTAKITTTANSIFLVLHQEKFHSVLEQIPAEARAEFDALVAQRTTENQQAGQQTDS